MAIFKSSTSRRREVRKTMPRKRTTLRATMARSQVWSGLALATVFAVVAAWLMIVGRAQPQYMPGQLVDRAVVAEVNFEAVDPQKTEEARIVARSRAVTVYNPPDAYLGELKTALLALPTIAGEAPTLEDVTVGIREKFGVKSEEVLAALGQHQINGESSKDWVTKVETFIEKMRETAILPFDRWQQERIRGADALHIITGEKSHEIVYRQTKETQFGPPAKRLWFNGGDPQDVRRAIDYAIERVEHEYANFPLVLKQVILNFTLQTPPTLRFNPTRSETEADLAAAKVEEKPVEYAAGIPLVSPQAVVPGEAIRGLSPAEYRLLVAHDRAVHAAFPVLHDVGPILLTVVITIGFIVIVVAQRPRIAQNPMRGLALLSLLLGVLALAVFTRPAHPAALAAAAIGPTVLAAVILAIAYDQRFAIAIASLLTVLIALALKLPVGLLLATVTACAVAILQLGEMRARGSLIRMGAVTALVAALVVIGAEMTGRGIVPGLMHAVLVEAAIAATACVLVGFFVLGMLPFIERTFKVTTPMTLLELCDVNQPLLRQLAQKSPGTYNHSLQVGTLVEAAAEAIGADALLARVGAYYHDIGKMHKPQYFIENQAGGANLHENLSPAMSLLIIVGHVKDGIEMAREFGLPPQLHHFIESHHGTTLVEYFYHAAKKQKGEDDGPEEIEFRYPGPKPQTKEAATLMLCDAVESATRAMSEPTAPRIEQLVDRIAMKRLMGGQFNQCELTLAELELISESVTKSLCAIYHGRISYPSDKEKPAKPSDARKAVAG